MEKTNCVVCGSVVEKWNIYHLCQRCYRERVDRELRELHDSFSGHKLSPDSTCEWCLADKKATV